MTADPGETPAGTADGTMVADLTAAKVAGAEVPPELLAQSLGQYLRRDVGRGGLRSGGEVGRHRGVRRPGRGLARVRGH